MTVDAGNIPVHQLNTLATVRTWTHFAIVRCSLQRVTVVTRFAALTVVTLGVVLADTLARVDVTLVAVAVAVAGHAAREWSTVDRLATIPCRAVLTELTDVAVQTPTLLHMRNRCAQCVVLIGC